MYKGNNARFKKKIFILRANVQNVVRQFEFGGSCCQMRFPIVILVDQPLIDKRYKSQPTLIENVFEVLSAHRKCQNERLPRFNLRKTG
jgi:hypothetical protein